MTKSLLELSVTKEKFDVKLIKSTLQQQTIWMFLGEKNYANLMYLKHMADAKSCLKLHNASASGIS